MWVLQQFILKVLEIKRQSAINSQTVKLSLSCALEINLILVILGIMDQAQNLENCASICSFCSRMKRGRIYACARKNGYNVLALGQHLDDLCERYQRRIQEKINHKNAFKYLFLKCKQRMIETSKMTSIRLHQPVVNTLCIKILVNCSKLILIWNMYYMYIIMVCYHHFSFLMSFFHNGILRTMKAHYDIE